MAACTKEQCLQQGVITIKTFLQNKKLLIAVVVHLFLGIISVVCLIVQGGINYYDSAWPFFMSYASDFIRGLVSFLLAVSAIVCNLNGKVRAAIVCAAIALVLKLAVSLSGGIMDILFILPEVALLAFLLMPERNIRMWSFIAWGAVALPVVAIFFYYLINVLDSLRYYGYNPSNYLISAIVANCTEYVPLGFVYFFGFRDKRNAIFSRTAAKRTTATPYLDEYKRNRLHGGK